MPEIICEGNCQHQKDGTCELDILSLPFRHSAPCPKLKQTSYFKKPDILPEL